MSATSTAATQQKFTNLRKRLDQLGYRQPLGVESLPLVEKLFSDLVHTTESLKKAKLQSNKVKEAPTNASSHVEAYKSDNAKLVKENNELHQQLIKAKEEADFRIKELKASLRKIEHENADLKFLNNQYVHKIRGQEKESKQKTEKILQLQEKNFHAVVQTPGGRKKNIPFRRQRMEIDASVPVREGALPASAPPSYMSQAQDPYVADLLKVADDNLAKLKEEVRICREQCEGLENKAEMYKKQVESRDAEIDRLTGMLEGGRPYDVVALESRNRSNERLISHLNIQIDYLQSKNAELQRAADEALYKARDIADETANLDTRNVELEQELHDVDRMAKSLQLDRESTIAAADRQISEAKLELQKSRDELTRMDVDVAQLKIEKGDLLSECEDLKAQLSSELADRQRLENLLDKVQEDKRKLGQRVTRLTATEKEMVVEIDRLKHRNGLKKSGKAPSSVDSFIKGLEEEKNYWKNEVEALQVMIRSTRSASPIRARSPSRSGSPVRTPVRTPVRSRSPSPTRRSQRSTPTKPLSRSSSPVNTSKGANQFESIIRVLEDERDHYKRECDILKASRSRPMSPSRLGKLSGDSDELLRVQRERDELQILLNKFERHMAEIQTNVKVLTGERDKLSAMYEEAREELNRVRREIVQSPKSAKTSLAAKAVLRRVENERDDAMVELRRMTTQRDSLQERLKIATDASLTDQARLCQRVEDLETALHAAEVERDSQEDRVVSLQRLADGLENQLKDQQLQLAMTRDDASAQTTTATQMRLLAEQAERSLGDTQSRLTYKDSELRSKEEQVLRLDDRMSELVRQGQRDRDEIDRLKLTLSALDREKDALQATVDDKTEKMASLGDELSTTEKHGTELRATVSDLEVQLDRAKDNMAAKEREISSLRRQLDGLSEELTEIGRGREVALRENRRLQDDLATMTRENQALDHDLQEVVREKEDIRNQVQDYIMDVKRCEELISAKELERSDLLEQYRTLTLDAENYETQTHQLESEISNLRLELITRDSEIRRLREKSDLLNREVDDRLHSEQVYDDQLSRLTKSVANLEERLRQVEDEKQNLLMDLVAARDLCARLEENKDVLQRNLTGKALDQEKLQSLLEDMKGETDMLRSQVNNERSAVNSLEGLLQNNREKEFQIQLLTQEKDTESQLLKDRLTLNESKVESQNREITMTRTKNIELDAEVERLRRQLTSERFERERAIQELRRHGLVPPGEGRLSRLSAASPASPSLTRSRSPGRSPTRSRSPYRRYDDI